MNSTDYDEFDKKTGNSSSYHKATTKSNSEVRRESHDRERDRDKEREKERSKEAVLNYSSPKGYTRDFQTNAKIFSPVKAPKNSNPGVGAGTNATALIQSYVPSKPKQSLATPKYRHEKSISGDRSSNNDSSDLKANLLRLISDDNDLPSSDPYGRYEGSSNSHSRSKDKKTRPSKSRDDRERERERDRDHHRDRDRERDRHRDRSDRQEKLDRLVPLEKPKSTYKSYDDTSSKTNFRSSESPDRREVRRRDDRKDNQNRDDRHRNDRDRERRREDDRKRDDKRRESRDPRDPKDDRRDRDRERNDKDRDRDRNVFREPHAYHPNPSSNQHNRPVSSNSSKKPISNSPPTGRDVKLERTDQIDYTNIDNEWMLTAESYPAKQERLRRAEQERSRQQEQQNHQHSHQHHSNMIYL